MSIKDMAITKMFELETDPNPPTKQLGYKILHDTGKYKTIIQWRLGVLSIFVEGNGYKSDTFVVALANPNWNFTSALDDGGYEQWSTKVRAQIVGK